MSENRQIAADPRLGRREVLARLLGGLLLGGALPAQQALAGPVTTDQYGDQNQTLPRRETPQFATSRGLNVQELYRFAVEQGQDLESIPCYCGCGGIGHRSNRACYIKNENRDGTVTYTSHAAT